MSNFANCDTDHSISNRYVLIIDVFTIFRRIKYRRNAAEHSDVVIRVTSTKPTVPSIVCKIFSALDSSPINGVLEANVVKGFSKGNVLIFSIY